ncbi:WSC domain-containing protein [Lyophyllum atratum]|nr:WSC domain-containing protein [Lyophyllum atratum]
MTVESCISFCTDGDYNYAGLEFGNCDSTIQIPGQPAPLSDCNFGCNGNNTESCGSSGRLNLLYNGQPGPTIAPTVANVNGDSWAYQGCFIDSTTRRTLAVPVNIPGGVTAQSCTSACQSLGGYTYAGMESGHECWCDNAINPPTQRVSDNDCRMVCDANHAQYCGNLDRIAVYRLSAAGDEGPQPCLSRDVANFTLVAAYKNPPGNGPTTVKLKVVVAELVPNVVWGVLSVRSFVGFGVRAGRC